MDRYGAGFVHHDLLGRFANDLDIAASHGGFVSMGPEWSKFQHRHIEVRVLARTIPQPNLLSCQTLWRGEKDDLSLPLL